MNELELSSKDYRLIAEQIRHNIFEPAKSKTISIFLCGADIKDKTKIRAKIAELIAKRFWYTFSYEIIFPEDLFEEILFSPQNIDILSLENLLAESVDVVVIVPESPGSFAELGAFANNDKLRSKVVVVIDTKYKKSKSFINQGPVRLIKNNNPSGIVFIEPEKLGLSSKSIILTPLTRDAEIEKILTAVRITRTMNLSTGDGITLLTLDKYLLPAIYLLEPVSNLALMQLVSHAIKNTNHVEMATTAAISILIKKRFIESTPDGYILTSAGISEFFEYKIKESRNKHVQKTLEIDNLRLEILNLKYRKKKLRV